MAAILNLSDPYLLAQKNSDLKPKFEAWAYFKVHNTKRLT